MGVMLDTSAVVGLRERAGDSRAIATAIRDHAGEDGRVWVHDAVLAELEAGVLGAQVRLTPDDVAHRRQSLNAARTLPVQHIEPDQDIGLFAEISVRATAKLSHNDRWIIAAAIRCDLTLIAQDERMRGAHPLLAQLGLKGVYVPQEVA